jgi:hypothetical protein
VAGLWTEFAGDEMHRVGHPLRTSVGGQRRDVGGDQVRLDAGAWSGDRQVRPDRLVVEWQVRSP